MKKAEKVKSVAGVDVNPLSLLLPYQRKWVEDASRYKIWLAARQIGKSFAAAAEAVTDCLVNHKAQWVVLSAGERQALEFMRKVRDWAEACELVVQDYREQGSLMEFKSAEVRFKNGSRIVALPANPDTARGYTANLILDEFAFHADSRAIWRAILPSISNPLKGELKVRVMSTANGESNQFFDLWNSDGGQWSKHKTTIYDARDQGLPVDIESLRANLDDAEGWAQEFECVFVQGQTELLPYALIQLAETPEATESCADFGANRHPLYLGIDFGRQNDPTVCWTLEFLGGILWTREVLVLQGMDTPAQQDVLRHRIGLATRVCFDYTGPGIGLGDAIAKEFGEWRPEAHTFGKVELCTFTAPFKRSLFPALRRAFEAPTRLRIPVSRAIREDLHAMQQVVANGQYNYWAPRTKDGHSDRCTALALAVRAVGSPSANGRFQLLENRRSTMRRAFAGVGAFA